MTGPAARSYFGFIYSRGTPVLPGEVRYQPASISCPTRFQRAPEPGPNSRSPQAGAIQHFAPPRTPPSTLNLASSFGLRCDESTGQDGVAGGRPRERSPSMRAQARRQSFNGRPRESPSASSRQASSGQDGQPSERPPRRTGLALTTGSGLPATALDSPDRVYIICVRIVGRSESGRLFHAPGAAQAGAPGLLFPHLLAFSIVSCSRSSSRCASGFAAIGRSLTFPKFRVAFSRTKSPVGQETPSKDFLKGAQNLAPCPKKVQGC